MKNWNEVTQDKNGEWKIIENGVTVRCPKCKASDIKPVHPFDYVKQCCKCGEQFSTGIHN